MARLLAEVAGYREGSTGFGGANELDEFRAISGYHCGLSGDFKEPGDFAGAENGGADRTVAGVTEEWLGTDHVGEGDGSC